MKMKKKLVLWVLDLLDVTASCEVHIEVSYTLDAYQFNGDGCAHFHSVQMGTVNRAVETHFDTNKTSVGLLNASH